MGAKKQNKNEGEKKNDGNGGGKKEDSGLITVVLKVDLHCEGCGSKVVKYLKGLDGVENAKADSDTNKVTVIGKVDPSVLREMLERKTKKKVELLSPAPKKDKKNEDGGGDKKEEKKQEKKAEDKKPKEPQVTTAVLKIDLHCAGCIDKIQRTVSKTKGVESKSIDKQKNLVTVTGTMDVKALVDSLKDRLKRPVEIVPPKKDAGGGGGGEKKGKDGDKKADGGGKKEEGVKAEENYFLHESMPGFGFTAGPGQSYPPHPAQMNAPGYGYGAGYGAGYAPAYGPGYGYGYAAESVAAPQMFSDENPNACSVM
ncbi:hypothetical protein PVL29_008062 [Vitis rotundifolia]|uniref:HMA domain-containing protein n=2 Tax=Vitis rotundifolia TaxID=103349 RepID=A0AA39DXP2_VITRO|nr:hypothetical protein PVL29_008062 [Vitis rotundifolia]